jgi:hypothetical protein
MLRGISDPREGSKILEFLFRPRLVRSSLLHLRSSWMGRSPNSFALKLSEKGSERDLEGGFGRYAEAEMAPKVPSRQSVGLRHGCFQGFSDSFLTDFSEVGQESSKYHSFE